MKKKILIVSDSLNMGGLEKCLINLCENFDYDKYEVDLYLFNEGRTLLEKLNKNVNLLPNSPYYKAVYNVSVFKSIMNLLAKGKFNFAWYRLIRFFRIRLKDYKYRRSDWKIMQQTMLTIDKTYDVAIGFAEGTSCYYVAECVSARTKIGWIHTDLKEVDHNREMDDSAFKKLDHIVTVSENSLKSLKELHPAYVSKYKEIKIPGLMNYREVDRLSKEENEMDSTTTNILSVGRLVELKGFHLCVEPCKRLIDEGYNVKWYVAGDGDYRDIIQEEIKKYALEDKFILLGNKQNPYTYYRTADIVVQPSSYEGFSVAVFESKYFQKAVVVSNIPSNKEMIEDGVNGIITERNKEDIYKAIKGLLDNPKKMEELAKKPISGNSTNTQIMQEIESLFD